MYSITHTVIVCLLLHRAAGNLTPAHPSPPPPPSPLATVLPFVITGGCSDQPALNNVEYVAAGFTASGAPYYRVPSSQVYMYWDPDCAGDGKPAAWIVGLRAPSTTALSDLHGDGKCHFAAYFVSDDGSSPPLGTKTWRVDCDGSFVNDDLTLARPSPSPPPSPPSPPSPPLATVLPFVITGGCSDQPALNNAEYVAAGYTASGAPYYRVPSSQVYMYWDPDCAGDGEPARWIVGNHTPSTTALSDLHHLHGDGKCHFAAYFVSDDPSSPPLGTKTWRVFCDGSVVNDDLTLARPKAVCTARVQEPRGRDEYNAIILASLALTVLLGCFNGWAVRKILAGGPRWGTALAVVNGCAGLLKLIVAVVLLAYLRCPGCRCTVAVSPRSFIFPIVAFVLGGMWLSRARAAWKLAANPRRPTNATATANTGTPAVQGGEMVELRA